MLKSETATLRVNCTLPSGSYYVDLVTARGGCFGVSKIESTLAIFWVVSLAPKSLSQN